MPPRRRPRPNVSQQPLAGAPKRNISPVREPQKQSAPSVAQKPTRRSERISNKQKDQPSKGRELELQPSTQTSKFEEDNPKSRLQGRTRKLSRPTEACPRSDVQNPPHQSVPRVPPEPKQSRLEHTKTIHRRGDALSRVGQAISSDGQSAKPRTSAQVATWVGGVNRDEPPEVVGISTIHGISALNEYLTSTPWYLNHGFDSSDEDMASPSIVTSRVTSKNQEKSKTPRCFELKNAKAVTVLAGRNVHFDRVRDKDREWIEDAILPRSDDSCSTKEEHNWENDLAKCQISDEAITQRTIMMDLINRHQLADTLDYTCESQWTCPSSMPERDSELASRMPRPKPDLAVAFKAESLLPFYLQMDLERFRSIMCPESSQEVKRDRAFHFLSIEVKGASGALANWIAHRQNFNTATQALNNIYVFMNMAGDEALKTFYDRVRFYSVVATGWSFHVRAHRAIELKEGRIEKNYPLGFEYDVVYNHQSEGGYTKATATTIVRNILIEYGIKTLKPLLTLNMKKVLDKLQSEKINGLQYEAEKQRTRGRTASRQSRAASVSSRPSRKTPVRKTPPTSTQALDASFARKAIDRFTVSSSTSPSSDA